MQYVMQGVMIATLVVMILNAVKYFRNNSLEKIPKDLNENKKQDTVFAITNFRGQTLLNEKCTTCHAYVKRDGATAILGFAERTPDKKRLYNFIRNSSEVIKSRDPYYNGLYKEYGVFMTPFPELTDEQINDVLEYMKQAEKLYGH
jgi:hypothetical protein